MIFSSLPFLLLFLPITVIIYHFLLQNKYGKYALPFLLFSSLFFYAYWDYAYLLIIVFSIGFNYFMGQSISKATQWKKLALTVGIGVNLLLLGYFKYTGFLLETVNDIFNAKLLSIPDIALPIGISFYTFQQIAYLVDTYKKEITYQGGFLEYANFVCFFPQLIIGPIVHHAEIIPQFADKQKQSINWENIYKGLYFLGMGLAKKVIIADNLAPLVDYCFDDANSLTFLEALFAGLAFTLQIYFDFSGYADMAIGCALFFNITLPFNFDSPFKAASISEFWSRWNITLSRWLRNYLFIPLGGSRHGMGRTLGNIFITFILGGIWHGASWLFVLWGTLHGLALIIHRVWCKVVNCKIPHFVGWFITFLFISLSCVLFRAISFERLNLFIEAFLGYSGFFIKQKFSSMAYKNWTETFIIQGGALEYSIAMTLVLLGVLVLKNSQVLVDYLKYKIFRLYVILITAIALFLLLLPEPSPEFIYFQF